VSALAELQEGKIGEAFVQLLNKTVYAVATGHNFPAPGGDFWSAGAVDEVVASFLADPGTVRRLDWLLLRCGDDRELARSLQGIVRNFLRDAGRATELGRLVVRIRRALRECEKFAPVFGDYWALTGGPTDASGIGPDELEAATAGVPVAFETWSPTARRREPFADKPSIEALIEAVLQRSAGALTPKEIARALALRLNVVTGPVFVELDPGDGVSDLSDVTAVTDFDHIVTTERAAEVAELLTDRERIALAHLELSARELAVRLGLGHSQAAVVRSRAVEVLKEELGQDDQGQEVAEVVLELCRTWIEKRTGANDMTYDK